MNKKILVIQLLLLLITIIIIIINIYYKIYSLNKINILEIYAKQNGIYSTNINYKLIYNTAIKVSKIFDIDYKYLLSFAIAESELVTNALNINVYTNYKGYTYMTYDKGLMQINTVWDDVVFGDDAKYDIMYDVYNNIYAGAYIIKYNMNKHKSLYKATWAYNGLTKSNEYYPNKILDIYYKLNMIENIILGNIDEASYSPTFAMSGGNN